MEHQSLVLSLLSCHNRRRQLHTSSRKQYILLCQCQVPVFPFFHK